MKKYLLLLLLILPFAVNAKSYTIKTKVGVEGTNLREGEFSFVLKDDKGNIVQTKTNDKDGNIIFDAIEWNENGIDTFTDVIENNRYVFKTVNNLYHIYTIEQIDNNIPGYTFDYEKTYVMVSDKGNVVKYFKYPSNERIENETPHYEWKPFHANDEDLQGTIYVENDKANKTVRVFRDEAGKYSENQVINGKTYSTMEEAAIGKNTISSAIYDDGMNDDEWTQYRKEIKKIIIDSPIRPLTGYYFFGAYPALEEIVGWENLDTSKMDSMGFMFSGTNNLKVYDLTHFDFSGITDEYGLNSFIVKRDVNNIDTEVKIAKFNIPAGVRTNDIFGFGISENYVNVKSNFKFMNNKDLANVISEDGITPQVDTMKFRGFFMNSNVKYMDLSDFKLHLFNSTTKRSYYDDGIEQFLNYNKVYYLDLTGLTTDLCAYRSNDIRLDNEELRVLKISDKNSSRNGLVLRKEITNDYLKGQIYLYNIDNNIVSSELTEGYGYNYLISTGGSNWDECDRYYHGGTWINIADDSAEYLNSYIKPEIKGVEENPKTGIIRYSLLILVLLIISIVFYNINKDKTVFNKE